MLGTNGKKIILNGIEIGLTHPHALLQERLVNGEINSYKKIQGGMMFYIEHQKCLGLKSKRFEKHGKKQKKEW
jgi:hypothetical protein